MSVHNYIRLYQENKNCKFPLMTFTYMIFPISSILTWCIFKPLKKECNKPAAGNSTLWINHEVSNQSNNLKITHWFPQFGSKVVIFSFVVSRIWNGLQNTKKILLINEDFFTLKQVKVLVYCLSCKLIYMYMSKFISKFQDITKLSFTTYRIYTRCTYIIDGRIKIRNFIN